MRTVHKYPLLSQGGNPLPIPVTAKVLLLAEQHGQLVLWVEVDLNHVVVSPRTFRIFGTGFDIPEGYEHRGSTMTTEGYLWHVYEELA